MAGRHLVENGLGVIDVIRHVAEPRGAFPSETDWDEMGRSRGPAVREAARGAGWRQTVDANPFGLADISWAINQATGGLRTEVANFVGNVDAVEGRAPVDVGWYRDPIVDEPDNGIAPQLVDLPSLNRRPGVVFLPPCRYVIDHPIHLYPGQTLRGAGVALDADGRIVGGTVIVLRGPSARISALRRDRGFRARGDCKTTPDLTVGPRAFCYDTQFGGVGFLPVVGDEAARLRRLGVVPRTPLVLDGFAVVDERPSNQVEADDGEAVAEWRGDALPALDLVGAQLLQLQNLVVVNAAGNEPPRTGLRLFLPLPDTSGYFNRVERVTFIGWARSIANGPGSSTLSVRDCEFTVPAGGSGVVVIAPATRVNGCRFVGVGPGPTGVGVEIRGTRLTHLRGNIFDNLAIPVTMGGTGDAHPGGEDPEHLTEDDATGEIARGLVSASANNLVRPRTNGDGADPLVQYAERPGTAFGTLISPQLVEKALWFQDGDAGAPNPATALGGENLISNVDLLELAPVEWTNETSPGFRWPRDAGTWFSHVVDGGRNARAADQPKQLLRPEATLDLRGNNVSGPRGPGLGRSYRIRFLEPLRPEMIRGYHLWQFVCPPTGTGVAGARAYLSRATRLTGRALAMAVWVRTNIVRRFAPANEADLRDAQDWISGVMGGLWRSSLYSRTRNGQSAGIFDDVDQQRALGRTSVHSGSGRWELLTGLGHVPVKDLLLDPGAKSSNNALRFAIRILRVDEVETSDGRDAYVDICTPFASTSMFPSYPHAPLLTENGGRLAGAIHPQVGPTTQVSLTTGPTPTPAAAMRAARAWRLVSATVSGSQLSRMGDVSLLDATRGVQVAFGHLAQRPGSTADLDLLVRDIPAGNALQLIAVDTEIPVHLALRLVPPDGLPGSRSLGF